MSFNDLDQVVREKRKLLRQLQRELEKLEEARSKRLKVSSEEIREIAKSIQLLAADRATDTDNVLDLVMQAIEKYPLKKGRRGGTRGPVPPKYRNPNDPSQTWTGRGRQPKWVAELLAGGYTIEQLEIHKREAVNQ